MSKLFVLGAAVLFLAGTAAAQTPATPTTGANQRAPTAAQDPNGNVGRPGASGSSANTPSTGEPTGTGTAQIDKKADTHDNTAAAPPSR